MSSIATADCNPMNYFAHGRDHLHRPYFLAGTAIPDLLSVVDRRMRVRRRHAQTFLDQPDVLCAEVAAGILQHLDDDLWFHQTLAFAELSLQFTRDLRAVLPEDDSYRPSFLGHILVEILLDAVLIEQQPERLDAYYAAFETIDPRVLSDAVNRMASRRSDTLAAFIPRFLSERFLYDYPDDAKLLGRLNHVMRRVKLTPLPSSILEFLPPARSEVRARRDELLSPDPNTPSPSDPSGGTLS